MFKHDLFITNTMLIIIGSILFTLLFLVGIGLIVFFAIKSSTSKNSEYENFAKENNFKFDKAMVAVSGYRDYSRNRGPSNLTISIDSPYIKKYANYSSFPFGRGTRKIVSYVIDGIYDNTNFRAFNYSFTGSLLDGSNSSGGVYSIVIIKADKIPSNLANDCFYENGIICHFIQGNLDVLKIKTRIEYLKKFLMDNNS